MPKHAGAYKGEKRRKELSRQKKQEERRKRRFHKGDPTPAETEKVEQEETSQPILNSIGLSGEKTSDSP
jgi:hypothetical protein